MNRERGANWLDYNVQLDKFEASYFSLSYVDVIMAFVKDCVEALFG